MKNNYFGFGERYITVSELIQFKIGDVFKAGVHWSNSGDYDGSDMFNGDYTYCFECRELSGHKVDYDQIYQDEDYADELYHKFGITAECESEKEIIVTNDMFSVISVNLKESEITENDFVEDNYKVPVTVRVKQLMKGGKSIC